MGEHGKSSYTTRSSTFTRNSRMSLLTKFTKHVTSAGYLNEWQRAACPSIKRHYSEVDKPKEKEPENEFRILRILPRKAKVEKPKVRTSKWSEKLAITESQYGENVDWTNVWVGPKTFDPYMVPMPLRQGYRQKGEPPGKYGNAELMKIPNFLHLTPAAITKHCNALKKFCTKWPQELETEEIMDEHFPITVIASDYCHSSPSIRDPLARIITLKVNISVFNFDQHARDKFLRLVGDRYDPKTGNVLITAKNCPLKKQNYDHAMYILTALCFESWKVEDWEKLKTIDDMSEYCFNLRKTKTNLEAYFDYTGKPHPSFEKIAEILETYVTGNKELELISSLKEEVMKLLNLPKFG